MPTLAFIVSDVSGIWCSLPGSPLYLIMKPNWKIETVES